MANRYATDGDLLALAPELSVLDPSFRVAWLEALECEINLVQWGDKASLAHTLLTAHVLTESPAFVSASGGASGGGSAAGGALTGVSVGPASVSWAQSATVDPTNRNYQTNAYGRRFANMIASTRPLPRIARRRC